jgi:hypothetical protein
MDTPDNQLIIPATSGTMLPARRRSDALRFILGLHRAPDGFASFSCTDQETGTWSESHSIQVHDLELMFPEFIDDFLNQYDPRVSVHSYLYPNHRASKIKLSEKVLKELPEGYRIKYKGFIAGALRKSERVKYINTCFTDLDIYKLDITRGQALGQIFDYMDKKIIPPVSMAVFSGHGAWPFWLLVDEKNRNLPPRYGPGTWEYFRRYAQIQRTLAERMKNLGADIKIAQNLTVSSRIPGGVHSETKLETIFWIPLKHIDSGGHVYTLDELEEFFGLHPPELAPVEKRAITGTYKLISDSSKANSFAPVHASRLRQFHTLLDVRGKFQDGTRNYGAYVYAHLLNRTGTPANEITRLVSDFGRNKCNPRLANYEIKWAIREALKIKYSPRLKTGGVITSRRISEFLEIKPEEAQYLETWTSTDKPPEPKIHPEKAQAEIIRMEIQKIIEEGRKIGKYRFTAPAIGRILQERGIATLTNRTVNNYLSAIGYGPRSQRSHQKDRQPKLNFDPPE